MHQDFIINRPPSVVRRLQSVVCLLQSVVCFKENKPNLLDAQMNVSSVLTKYYENVPLRRRGQNKAKTNPTCSELACGACPACPEPVEGSLPKGARSNRRTYFKGCRS